MKRTFLMSAVLIPLCLCAEGIKLKCAPIEAKVYRQNQTAIDSLFSQRYPEEVMRINYFYHVPKEGREKECHRAGRAHHRNPQSFRIAV